MRLRLQPPLAFAEARFGGAAFHRPHAGLPDQGQQAVGHILAVAVLRAVLPAGHDDDTVAGQALASQGLQPDFDLVRQREGSAGVEAQLRCRGDLVDVLAAGSAGLDEADFDFGRVDR
jgi:hypothetical protein